MHILTVSLNYKQTPVEVREKFAVSETELPEALAALRKTKSILECVLLSTCNRTEIFALVDQLHRGRDFIVRFMSDWFGVKREDFISCIQYKENDQAIRHLFRLACGLDSMVIGETQILGQVKQAFFAAQKEKTTGTIFNTLFKNVITLAKRAHAHTKIGQHAVSVSYAAVELSRQIHGELSNKKALIIGAGKMSELTLKHLADQGVNQITVVNRTVEKAEELAKPFGGSALGIDHLDEAVKEADIVISSTGARGYVLTQEQIKEAMLGRSHRPLFVIDIAVPRDVDPAVGELDQVFLYDIDDLNGIVEANLEEREKEAKLVEAMIEEELVSFKHWLHTLGVVPLITALQEKAKGIQEEAMRKIENKLPDLTENELRLIRKYTKSIINQMMHDPIVRIKEMAAQRGSKEALHLFAEIFALEDHLHKEEDIDPVRRLAENLDPKSVNKPVYAEELPVKG